MLAGKAGLIFCPDDVMRGAPDVARRIELEFLTPTSIKVAGRWLSDLRFEHLVRDLLCRVRLLSYFHCGEELNVDVPSLLKAADGITHESHLRWFRSRLAGRTVQQMLSRWVGSSVGSASRATLHRSFLLFSSASIYISVIIRRLGMGSIGSGVLLGSLSYAHVLLALTHTYPET